MTNDEFPDAARDAQQLVIAQVVVGAIVGGLLAAIIVPMFV